MSYNPNYKSVFLLHFFFFFSLLFCFQDCYLPLRAHMQFWIWYGINSFSEWRIKKKIVYSLHKNLKNRFTSWDYYYVKWWAPVTFYSHFFLLFSFFILFLFVFYMVVYLKYFNCFVVSLLLYKHEICIFFFWFLFLFVFFLRNSKKLKIKKRKKKFVYFINALWPSHLNYLIVSEESKIIKIFKQ